MPAFLRTRWSRLLAWIAGLYAIFALLTWWAVPFAVRRAVRALPKDMPGFQAGIRDASFNPFKLALTVRGFAFSHQKLGYIATCDEFYAGAQPLDLLRLALGARYLRFTRPILRATITANGQSALDYLPRPKPLPPGAKEKPLFIPRLVVHRFEIVRGALELDSLLPAAPQKISTDPINFKLKNLSTLRNSEGALDLTGSTDHDERLRWSGNVTVRPSRLTGRFAAQDLDLSRETTGAPGLPVALPAGRADISAGYNIFYAKGVLTATLTDARAAVRGLFWNRREPRTEPRGPFSMEFGPGRAALRLPVPLAGKKANLTINTQAAGSGRLALRASVSSSLAGTIALHVTDLPLAPFSPFTPPPTQLTINSGTLALDESLVLPGAGGGLSANASFTVDNFLLSDRVSLRTLAHFNRLEVENAQAAAKAGTLSIERMNLTGLYLRLFRGADGLTNIETALGVRFPSSAAGRGKNQPAAAAPGTAGRAMPMHISLDRFHMDGGKVVVQDESVSPAFSLTVRKASADLADLSTDNLSTAAFSAQGLVEAAPFKVSGTVRVAGEKVWADTKLSAHRIQLAAFSPYSGKMIGYKLDRGTLDLELAENLAVRRIESSNRFIADKLTLGDKVESPDALKVPVKLGLAILRDRNGVIDLDVPVSGSLDDPAFRLMPLIIKAIVNIVVKAALSPFDVLGKAFGGGSDLGHVAFAPGSAVLDAAAQAGLDKTSQALADRPSLIIGVRGETARPDAAALGDIALRRKLRGHEAGAAVLTPGEQKKVLALYTKSFGKPAPPPAEAREKLAAGLAGAAELRALSLARAEVIRKYLEGKGVTPERFFSLEPASAPGDKPAQCELQLDVR